MINRQRSAIAGIVLSASALVGLALHEGWSDTAVVPVKNDRPTVGFGSTFREDGTAVRMGDTITPPKALARTLAHIQKDESQIKRCVTAPLHQYEYDAAVSLAYNIGTSAFCSSTVVRRFNAGDYAGACDAFLMWNKFQGKELRGLTLRRQRERAVCLGLGQ